MTSFFRLLDGQTGGRNYWWPDNGYGTGLSAAKGLNRVLWDRTLFFEHVNETTCGRPAVFIPFGGLGSGRMPCVILPQCYPSTFPSTTLALR